MSGPAGASAADWVARTQRALERFHWLSLQEAPGARRRDWAEAVAMGSALPSSATNSLFVRSATSDLDGILPEVREFFRRSPSWRLTCPGRPERAVVTAVERAGLSVGESVPRMLLFPVPPNPPPTPELVVRRVETVRQLEDFIEVEVRAFGIPRRVARAAFARHAGRAANEGSSIEWRVGYFRERPVATSSHLTFDGLTSIFFVGTVPEARHRGFGRAMTWAAIDAGRRQGAEAAWLSSSPMGRPLYESIGFRWLCDDREWVRPLGGLGALRRALWYLGIVLRSPGPTEDPR